MTLGKKKKLFEPALNKSNELWLAFLLRLSRSLSTQPQPQPTSSDTTTAIIIIDGRFFLYLFYIISILISCFSYNNYFHLNSHLNNYNVGYHCHNSSSSSINRAAVLAATVAAVGCQQHGLETTHVSSRWYVFFWFFHFFNYTNV